MKYLIDINTLKLLFFLIYTLMLFSTKQKRLYGCCGGEAYRSGWNPMCCGGVKLYDIYTHYCTEKQIVEPVLPGVLPTFNFNDDEEEE